jgi:pyrroloquinoline quinone biosynthesis protein B
MAAACAIEHRVYIHMHNTNPLLIENSSQRQAAVAPGIEVAYDGMEMEI